MNSFDLRREFEELLIKEAWLLDNDKYDEWLDLFDENTRYWAPVRENLDRGNEDFSTPHLLSHFDDNKMTLGFRVKRLATGYAHAEEPPSRTRHFVSNVQILEKETDRVRVESNFIVFRGRPGKDETFFVGVRRDWWRKDPKGWINEERLGIFDHDVIESITIFF